MIAKTDDVANSGWIRPPLVYLTAMLCGAGLNVLWPLHWLPPGAASWIGAPLILLSLLVFVTSIQRFKAVGTPVPGNQPTVAIVQAGPYAFSRNPIYLAFTLLGLGTACSLNSIWLLITVLIAVTLMALVVIPREERYLERRFGVAYLDYKAKVRRWF